MPARLFFIFFVFLFLLAIPSAFSAQSLSSEATVFGGFAIFDQNVGRLSNSASGTPSLTSALYFNLSVSAEFGIGDTWYFSPLVAYSPFGMKSADENEKSTLLPLALRMEKKFETFDLHAGPGILFYKISGSGGTVSLANGTGTAVFGLPSESHSTLLAAINLGAGTHSSSFYSAFDLFITGLASSRRAVNLALSLSYGIF